MSEPTTNQKSGRNQRRSRRQTAKGSTKAIVYRNALGVGANIGVRVLDLSEIGVRLIIREELRPGTEFEIELGNVARRAVRVLAQIVWSVPSADGQFVVGAKFGKSLDYATLQELSRS